MSLSTTHAETVTVLFGTDANRSSKGIYATQLDTATGRWSGELSLAAELSAPGWQTLHPSLPVLYSSGAKAGTKDQRVSSFRFAKQDDRLVLQPLNDVESRPGSVTHIAVDPAARMLVTVQYGASTVCVYRLNPDGSIGEETQSLQLGEGTRVHPTRQQKAHPHYATFDPSGRHVLVPDLGADAVLVYRADPETAQLTLRQKAAATPGAGPRHMKFSPDGRFAWVLNELSLTVATYAWDADKGELSFLAEVPSLPPALKEKELENTASEIQVHPDGRFVYTGSRGNDSVSVFRADAQTGALELVEVEPARTAWPRHFTLDPTSRWLICGGQDGSTAGIFAVDQETGALTYRPHSSIVVPGPICVTIIR